MLRSSAGHTGQPLIHHEIRLASEQANALWYAALQRALYDKGMTFFRQHGTRRLCFLMKSWGAMPVTRRENRPVLQQSFKGVGVSAATNDALSKLSALRTAGDASDFAAARTRRPRSVPCCPCCGDAKGLAGSDAVCRRRTSASNGDAKAPPPPGERWPATVALCGLLTRPTTGVASGEAFGAVNSGESGAADRCNVDGPPSSPPQPRAHSRRAGVAPGSCPWLEESAAILGKVLNCPEPEERYCSGLAIPPPWSAADLRKVCE